MNRVIGSTFIVAGTAIGAGMLGLPMVSAGAGFGWAAGLLVGLWALSYAMALLILEVTLAFEAPASFNTMAHATLGSVGSFFMNLTFLLLLYTLSVAYIVGGASLFESVLHKFHIVLSPVLAKVVFTAFFGAFVYVSTAAVDAANRVLFTLKVGIFLIALFFASGNLHFSYFKTTLKDFPLLWTSIPVFFTAYGYHVIIPSVTHYLENDTKKAKFVLFLGSALPLALYLLWLVLSFGLLPRLGENSFLTVMQKGGDVGYFITALSLASGREILTLGINAFSDLAITTSFLGVALGLFDFMMDALKCKNDHKGRLVSVLVTLLPPLLLAIFYQNFLKLLGFAGVFFIFSGLILPVLMFYRLRFNPEKFPTTYRVPKGIWIATVTLVSGIGILALQVMSHFDVLPKFVN